MKQSIGQIEAKITESIIQFERDHMGRGPRLTKTKILDDMIIVRLDGVLTPSELQLAKNAEGVKLLKEVRTRLIEGAEALLKTMVKTVTGQEVLSIHSDISAQRGERVIIFILSPL
jgi:uncharacterized protein YbcI